MRPSTHAFNDNTPTCQALLDSVPRCFGSLSGIQTYWSNQRRALGAMICGLGIHWESHEAYTVLSEVGDALKIRKRLKITTQNLKENPHTAPN